MTRKLIPSTLLLAASLLAQSLAHAQTTPQATPQTTTPQTTTPQTDTPFILPTVRVSLVNLVFTVTDSHGRFIKNLKRENFGLLDNLRPPSAVIDFKQQTNLPLRIGIMIDTSNSIRTRFSFEQQAAQDFFDQVVHPADRAFVEGFDTAIELSQDYTANKALLNEGIRKLRPGGGTSLFDALYNTCQAQMLTLHEDFEIRKVIVLLSDGDDNYSIAPLSDALKMCQRAETTIYTISTDTSPTRGKGGEVLKMISEATGGQVFYPVKLEDVSNGFASIEEELRSQYSLEYRPADFKADGTFRTIYLRSTNGRYHVRTRAGYFAPKPAQ